MKKEIREAIAKRKKEATELVRYANPNSRKSRPTKERILELLDKHIPYNVIERSSISEFIVLSHNKNRLIESGQYLVTLNNGKKFRIDAYRNLTVCTAEEKKADKTATFPSGLFKTFYTEIKNQKEE